MFTNYTEDSSWSIRNFFFSFKSFTPPTCQLLYYRVQLRGSNCPTLALHLPEGDSRCLLPVTSVGLYDIVPFNVILDRLETQGLIPFFIISKSRESFSNSFSFLLLIFDSSLLVP